MSRDMETDVHSEHSTTVELEGLFSTSNTFGRREYNTRTEAASERSNQVCKRDSSTFGSAVSHHCACKFTYALGSTPI